MLVFFLFSLLIVHSWCIICSFEKSPRHDAYVPRFEAELAQYCEKLVSFLLLNFMNIFLLRGNRCVYYRQWT